MSASNQHSVQDDLFLLRAALGHPPNPAYAAAVDRLEEQSGRYELALRDILDRTHISHEDCECAHDIAREALGD